jgi:hypothetical protein
MGNPYFKTTYDPGNNESMLYQSATDELCEMLGVDFKYVIKTLVKPDYVFGEDTLKEFNDHRDVTMFIENYENFDGVDDMFSKFGFEVDNRLILIIERRRFKTYTQLDEPAVDDLIYHPNSGKTFQIKHVDVNENFFQMNGGMDRFKITCELFTPSGETFDADIDDVDALSAIFSSDNDLEGDQRDTEKDDTLDLTESDVFGNL